MWNARHIAKTLWKSFLIWTHHGFSCGGRNTLHIMPHAAVWLLPLGASCTLLADWFSHHRAVLVSSAILQATVVVGLIVSGTSKGVIGGHWLPSLALYRGAATTLLETACPWCRWRLAVIGGVMFIGIIAGEIWTAGVGHFYNWIHILIYSLGGVLCGSSAITSPSGRLVRRVTDPLCLCALAGLFIGHEHDTNPLAVLIHTYFGRALVVLAVNMFLPRRPRRTAQQHAAAGDLLAATSYLFPGVWLQQMAIMFYSTRNPKTGSQEGLHHELEAKGIVAKTPVEAALAYVALTCLISALLLPMLTLSTWRGASGPVPTSVALTRTARVHEDAAEQSVPLVEEA